MSDENLKDSQAKMRRRIEELTGRTAEANLQGTAKKAANPARAKAAQTVAQKGQNESRENVQSVNRWNAQNVNVVGLDIPFEDLCWFTLKAAFASLLVISLPTFILISYILDRFSEIAFGLR